jgi:predicted Zn-dependent protease
MAKNECIEWGQKPPPFLSTHPTEEKRIEELSKIMDETVKNYYRPAQ